MAARTQRSLPSLRLWLQSTTLLAVIAGYALLLGVNRSLNQAQRLDDHRQLVETLRTSGPALERPSRRMLLSWPEWVDGSMDMEEVTLETPSASMTMNPLRLS